MNITINISSPYTEYFLKDEINLEFEGNMISVKEIKNRIITYCDIDNLKRLGLVQNDSIVALVISNNKILKNEDYVKDSEIIKLLYPMTGG